VDHSVDQGGQTSDQHMIVGSEIHVRGDVGGDGSLTVVGRIDGSIKLTESVVVERSGIVVADVEANKALVSGTVVGNIVAKEVVHITPEGRVVGDLTVPRVVLDEGASFSGNIDMGRDAVPAAPSRGQEPAVSAESDQEQAAEKARKPSRSQPSRSRAVQTATSRKSASSGARSVARQSTTRSQAAVRKSNGSSERIPARKTSSSRAKARQATRSKSKPPRPPTAAGKKSRIKRR